jgi:hypothetical protein
LGFGKVGFKHSLVDPCISPQLLPSLAHTSRHRHFLP